jgi:hypothetical protein
MAPPALMRVLLLTALVTACLMLFTSPGPPQLQLGASPPRAGSQREQRPGIAFEFCLHGDPDVWNRTMAHLWDPRNVYIVHVDAGASAAVWSGTMAVAVGYNGTGNVHLVPRARSRRVTYLGVSLVDTPHVVRGTAQTVFDVGLCECGACGGRRSREQQFADVFGSCGLCLCHTYFLYLPFYSIRVALQVINLSGADYPLVPLSVVRAFLSRGDVHGWSFVQTWRGGAPYISKVWQGMADRAGTLSVWRDARRGSGKRGAMCGWRTRARACQR